MVIEPSPFCAIRLNQPDLLNALDEATLAQVDLNTLELKDIPGYSHYLASNQGFIVKASGGEPPTFKVSYGNPSKDDQYMRLSVYSDAKESYETTYIHRLIALAFHGVPPDGNTDVHHIDGNPRNNLPGNLMWCSHQYNCGQRNHPNKGRSIIQIDLDTKNVIAQWDSISAAARSVGKGSSHALGNALLRKGGEHTLYGYMWRYGTMEEEQNNTSC